MGAKKDNYTAIGHLLAVITTLIWGVTFVCTKVLLVDFTPFEIMLSRFSLAFIAMCILRPRILRTKSWKHEALFALAGLTGVIGYFVIENTALSMATASNVSICVDTAPMFIALVASIAGIERGITPGFVVGFLIAMAGVVIIGASGGDAQAAQAANMAQAAPFTGAGELLAICAAATWGVYSSVVVRLGNHGYETVAMTKRIFAWGIVLALLLAPFFGFRLDFGRYMDAVNAGNLLFLGLVASGACFVMWGEASKRIGPSKTGVYLYLQPVSTCIVAFFVLGEAITGKMVVGIVLVLLGLLISEGRLRMRRLPRESLDGSSQETS